MVVCSVSSPETAHTHKEMTPQNWTLDPPLPDPKTPRSLKSLYALYFAGRNDTSIKNSGPETSLMDPLPDSL